MQEVLFCGVLTGIKLAEISTLPPSIIREARELSEKLANERKVRLFHPLSIM